MKNIDDTILREKIRRRPKLLPVKTVAEKRRNKPDRTPRKEKGHSE